MRLNLRAIGCLSVAMLLAGCNLVGNLTLTNANNHGKSQVRVGQTVAVNLNETIPSNITAQTIGTGPSVVLERTALFFDKDGEHALFLVVAKPGVPPSGTVVTISASTPGTTSSWWWNSVVVLPPGV